MTGQLEGQLDLLDLLPTTCRHCGASVEPERHPYDAHHFTRIHAEARPGVCEEMAWALRGYRHAVWAVDNFDLWFTLALRGTERHAKQLQTTTEERDRFEALCAAYTASCVGAWVEQLA